MEISLLRWTEPISIPEMMLGAQKWDHQVSGSQMEEVTDLHS
jgi:hypothetical protein